MDTTAPGADGTDSLTEQTLEQLVQSVEAAPGTEQSFAALTLLLRTFPDDRQFIERFFRIINKDGVAVPFKFNKAQVILYERIKQMEREGRRIRMVILKARQLGCSVFVQAYLLMRALRKANTNCLVIADSDENARFLFAHGKRFFDCVPARPATKYSTKEEIEFLPPLSSLITIQSAKNIDAGRSRTIHNVHASEVASWTNAKGTMMALAPAITPSIDSWLILESTAKGIGGYFHEQWKNAEKGLSDYEPVFLAWWLADEYQLGPESLDYKNIVEGDLDEEELVLRDKMGVGPGHLAWRRAYIRNEAGGSVEIFHQEYPSSPEEAFLVSGRPVFPMAKLQEMEGSLEEPLFRGEVEVDESLVRREYSF